VELFHLLLHAGLSRRFRKIQQNISGRLTSEQRTKDRYKILGYVSSAAKHGLNKMTVLRDAILGRAWMPELPVPP
jgi:transposase